MKNIIPKDKFDMVSATNLVKVSDENILLHIDGLFECLQDRNWPIYESISDRLAKIPEKKLIKPLKKILKGDDALWRYWILTDFIPKLTPSILKNIHKELLLLANEPSLDDKEEEIDKIANKLLRKKA